MSHRDRFLERAGQVGDTHKRAPRQEEELARRGRGVVTNRSGAGYWQKSDVAKYEGIFRVEAKVTKKKSFSVNREMWKKAQDAAYPAGEHPCIVIEFVDDDGNKVEEVAVVPTYVLTGYAETYYGNT